MRIRLRPLSRREIEKCERESVCEFGVMLGCEHKSHMSASLEIKITTKKSQKCVREL
jgi:hypothetical protein